jgi:hypothetical protein
VLCRHSLVEALRACCDAASIEDDRKADLIPNEAWPDIPPQECMLVGSGMLAPMSKFPGITIRMSAASLH